MNGSKEAGIVTDMTRACSLRHNPQQLVLLTLSLRHLESLSIELASLESPLQPALLVIHQRAKVTVSPPSQCLLANGQSIQRPSYGLFAPVSGQMMGTVK